MKQYGLVKVIKINDEDEIKLCGNAMTFILYKSYFGKDLLNDIIGFAKKNSSPQTLEKLKELKIEKVDDIESLSAEQTKQVLETIDEYSFDSEFILNFLASLMATALYPEKVDIVDLIMSIPPYFVSDTKIINELLEFFSLFISQKKR